jgi:RNA polymerase sigma factor (sigma-70 family)
MRLLAAQSDQRLLELARRGHERAFEAVVQRYRRPLLRYCARMGLQDGAAEDVLQLALLRAWLALERQVEIRELRPWLFRIVHNTAVNALRGSREDRHAPVEDADGHARTAVESELERRIALRDALTGVAALPQMQRQAIVLSAFGGHSQEEVAEVLGVTDGAVRGLLYRARATLRGAAAAFTPQPLISWACGAGAAPPAAERLAELSGPVGAAGMAGVLVKGAAVAVTAAVVVAGSAVVHRERAGANRANAHGAGASARAMSGSSPAGGLARAQALASARLTPVRSALEVTAGDRAGSGARAFGGTVQRRGGSRSGGRPLETSSFASPLDRRQSRDGAGSGDRSDLTGSDPTASRERGATRPSSEPSGTGGDGQDASTKGSGDAMTPQSQGGTSSGVAPSSADGSRGPDGGATQTTTTSGQPATAVGTASPMTQAPLAPGVQPSD